MLYAEQLLWSMLQTAVETATDNQMFRKEKIADATKIIELQDKLLSKQEEDMAKSVICRRS